MFYFLHAKYCNCYGPESISATATLKCCCWGSSRCIYLQDCKGIATNQDIATLESGLGRRACSSSLEFNRWGLFFFSLLILSSADAQVVICHCIAHTSMLSSEQKYYEENCCPTAVLAVSDPNKSPVYWHSVCLLIIAGCHRCSTDEYYRYIYQYTFHKSI